MSKNPISKEIRSPLLTWYRQTRRPLPWRDGKDPYRIWISEIMLQQTRIEAVIPYYHRFLSEIPSVSELATVEDDRLMKLWEGLGYYSRARNLKTAAIQMMNEHNGCLPADYSALRHLKGIGDYTAGAIASIAFGLPEPAVDGNVLRVIMRLCGREDDIALPATKKAVTEWLREIYPTGADAGDLTEGLMELGEKICIPTGIPKCAECPLQAFCVAKKEGRQCELPRKSAKKERRIEKYTIFLLCHEGKIAVQKRPPQGLLAGLWEFPNCAGHLSKADVLSRLQEKKLSPASIEACGTASHIFTHITWNMIGYAVECQEKSDDYHWVTIEDLTAQIAIPTAFRFYLHYLLQQ